MARRDLDAYFTPPYMTNALLDLVPEIRGNVFEPCAGDGDISNTLMDGGKGRKRFPKIFTNDIDGDRDTHFHFDASKPLLWPAKLGAAAEQIDWVITNPPYDHKILLPIVQNSLQFAKKGVAMLLRLSFEEPTKTGANARGPFLDKDENRIVKRLVMPRHSFTGDGKSDSVTVAWMIWSNEPLEGWPNISVHRARERYSK
jgi:hypothetical protein